MIGGDAAVLEAGLEQIPAPFNLHWPESVTFQHGCQGGRRVHFHFAFVQCRRPGKDIERLPVTGMKSSGSDGETSGYWLLFLATPYHGCAITCHFVSYSSKTINKELSGDKPLVLDREFSYLELMENMTKEEVNFVIHFKKSPNFCDSEGKPVTLSIAKGETRILNKISYPACSSC